MAQHLEPVRALPTASSPPTRLTMSIAEAAELLGINVGGVAFVAANLEAEGLERALRSSLDPGAPTTIVCESVLPYLTPRSAARLLKSLSRLSARNGYLAADLPLIPTSLKGRVTFWTWRMLARAIGEPVRTALTAAAIPAFLEAGGWHGQRRVTGGELEMPSSRSEWCFVTATSGPASAVSPTAPSP